jgi:hypothetical protein
MAGLIQVGCYLRPQQLDSLRALTAITHVPMAAYLRLAVDQLLLQHVLPPKKGAGGRRMATLGEKK